MPMMLEALGAVNSILWKLINMDGIQLCTSVMPQVLLAMFQAVTDQVVANRFTKLTQVLMVLVRATKSTP